VSTKKWFERAKAEQLIQVKENHTREKNKVTWHERNHKGQLNVSVPKDMGNGSTQPRQECMIHQEEAQRAQHRSWTSEITRSLKKRHKGLNTNHVTIENTSQPSAPQEEAKGLNTTDIRAQNSQAHPKHMN
jgi:hypothetical protein